MLSSLHQSLKVLRYFLRKRVIMISLIIDSMKSVGESAIETSLPWVVRILSAPMVDTGECRPRPPPRFKSCA